MVETVKRDPETSIAYLRLQEKLSRSRKEGKKEGREEGREEGRKEGDLQRLVTLVCKKMKKNKTLEEIAGDLEEEIKTIEPICRAAEKFAPEYDPDLVFEELRKSEG